MGGSAVCIYEHRLNYTTDGNDIPEGAFVDVGVHQDGLVHISKLANRFVKHPNDVVCVGDTVKVWVEKVDRDRKKISLTMVQGK